MYSVLYTKDSVSGWSVRLFSANICPSLSLSFQFYVLTIRPMVPCPGFYNERCSNDQYFHQITVVDQPTRNDSPATGTPLRRHLASATILMRQPEKKTERHQLLPRHLGASFRAVTQLAT